MTWEFGQSTEGMAYFLLYSGFKSLSQISWIVSEGLSGSTYPNSWFRLLAYFLGFTPLASVVVKISKVASFSYLMPEFGLQGQLGLATHLPLFTVSPLAHLGFGAVTGYSDLLHGCWLLLNGVFWEKESGMCWFLKSLCSEAGIAFPLNSTNQSSHRAHPVNSIKSKN